MNKEDKLILGTLVGVDLVLSPEHYEEYKGTLNKQLEEKDKEIERLNNIINEAKEECKSVIEDSEHTTVSEFNINGLMRTILNILNKGDSNE